MKAIVSNKYGSADVLRLEDVNKPLPGENEVLIKVKASSLNYGNLVLLKGEPYLARFAFGLRKPKYPIPGGDVAGRIEAVGEKVKKFKVGDEVFGDLSGSGWGAYAEYAVAPENALSLKPSKLSFEEAAAVPMSAVTALQAIRDKGNIQKGQKVLINGGSGGVGTFAIQIAKSFDTHVTAVVSTGNVEVARSLGADHVIDYKQENFTEGNERFDLIIGVNGQHPITAYKRTLNDGGRFIHVGGSPKQLSQVMMMGPFLSMTGNKKLSSFLQRANENDLDTMRKLIDEGKVKPVIDRVYKLDEIQEAFKYFEQGHAKGKVIITV